MKAPNPKTEGFSRITGHRWETMATSGLIKEGKFRYSSDLSLSIPSWIFSLRSEVIRAILHDTW